MADKIVKLVDKNSNNLYPVAGAVIDNAVSTGAISNQAVTTAKIADANVTTVKLANNAVTTAKITDLNVTTGKLANGAVTGVANNATSIGTAKLALDTVGTPNLRDASVTSDKIDWTTIGNKHNFVDNGTSLSTSWEDILDVVCSVAGTYLIIASFSGYSGTSGAYITSQIRVNEVLCGETIVGVVDGRAQSTILAQATLNVGDKAQLYGKTSAGGLSLNNRHNTISIIRMY